MKKVTVSIVCDVYNHEPYLRQCLDGFVMQKTNFPFEILIHDDASTDKSADVIREYANKYPDLFKPIYQIENQYSKGVSTWRDIQVPRAKGRYIALCEGDDYWIDPLKLQKQVDFLESHSEVDLCCSASKVYVQSTKSFQKVGGSILCEEYESCIQGTNDIFTATVVVRHDAWKRCISELLVFLPDELLFDTAYWYWFAYHRKVKFLDEPMAVYRVLENSACHTTDNKVESYMQWRFLRLKLYFLLYYPLRKNQQETIKQIITEIERHAEWEHYCGQLEVRDSKTYRLGKLIINPFKKFFNSK